VTLGTVRIPNPEMCYQWMEDRWNFSICAQKAHPACFQRMNSWDGNLLDLPSCLDLGLCQSASNFPGTLSVAGLVDCRSQSGPEISRGRCPEVLVNAVTENIAMATRWYFPALVTGETGVMKSALSCCMQLIDCCPVAFTPLPHYSCKSHCLAAVP
jgi:hypothetical protein